MGCVRVKDVKHRIMLVQMLLGDDLTIMVERLDVHLFIWKKKCRCVDLLQKRWCDVTLTIFICAI